MEPFLSQVRYLFIESDGNEIWVTPNVLQFNGFDFLSQNKVAKSGLNAEAIGSGIKEDSRSACCR